MEKQRAVRKTAPIDALIIPSLTPPRGNIIAKLIYGYLHHELPSEEVYNIFSQLPGFADMQKPDPAQFFDHLWDEHAANSSQILGQIISAFEQALYSHNKNIDSFHHFIKTSINHQSDLFTWSVFPAFQPLLKQIGMKEYLLRNAYRIPPCILPNVESSLIAFQKNESGFSATIAIFSDRSNTAVPIDTDLVLGPICRLFPLLFGVSPFTSYKTICDEVSIESKMKSFAAPTIKPDSVVFDNKEIGHAISFSSFIAAHDLPYEGTAFTGKQVIISDADVYCPKQQRIIIHKGCAFGAPFSILKLYLSPEKSLETGLDMFNNKKHRSLWPVIHRKHEHLKSEIIPAAKIHVRFNSRMQSISINGRHLISGIPAKILCSIVKTYIESDLAEFEWSDLAANRELISHPNNTGLTTRLNRIAECLCKTPTGITLEKFGRGKYRLSSTKPISFSEV